jgi:hypothetical protein
MAETYKLAHPIIRKLKVNGMQETEDTIEEVEVRRLNGGDIRWQESQANKGAMALGLIGRVTGLHSSVIDLMDAEDIAGISELVASFLPPSLQVGETS